MKKVKSISVIVITVLFLGMLSGCSQIVGMFGRGPVLDDSSVPEADLSNLPYIEGIDFAYEIEYFNSTMLNTFTLHVGDSHTPTASVWTDGKEGQCFSSDESVVFVANNGNVFAKGKGTAYVIIRASVSSSMFEIYKYVVK